ncbi:MAG: substrate-binding domain-containing protein [Anaerolineae bacterium]|nr:substrate-binding domain-containing protein [Anaerolineae bacterium]
MVRSDSVGGAHDLTCHLLNLGHRRIAMLSGPREVSTAVDRVAGYRSALLEAGIPWDDHIVIYETFTREGGHTMAQRVITLKPHPTALFAGNNFIAIGAFRALREAGLDVPSDVSLVSFDDLPPNFSLEPFLTVVAQRAYEMGQTATRQLLKRLSEGPCDSPEEILLPTDLVVRRSSAKARVTE